jgi:anthranilate phosphoribosyltransferase
MTATRFARPLSGEAMAEVMEAIMAGGLPAGDIREFLLTLAERGETAQEIATAAEVVRRHALPLPLTHAEGLGDTCGTGGDAAGTINVSTLAALAAAGAGARIAKHGNRAASSRCGSADLLEALGLNLAASPQQVAACIDEVGFGFCFAPAFHPAMKAVAPIRRELGIRTLFNLIGPLANPAPLAFQLLGVADARLLRPMAEALTRLGVRRGMIVHGLDGLDEVTTTTRTQVIEVEDGASREYELDPAAFGLAPAGREALRGGDVELNVRLAREVLSGAASPIRDVVALNAACALYLAGRSATVREGLAAARAALEQGRAAAILERVRALTHAG